MPYLDREAQRAYQREWLRRRREAWLAANGPCVDCGSWDRPEVDHVDASQKVSHNVWSWSAERRKAELAKCVVRCHDCHQRKTKENGEDAPRGERHGSAKLTEPDIRAIRASSETEKELARRYGVHWRTIGKIRRRERWKHLA